MSSDVDKARLGVITLLYASPYQNLAAWIQVAGTYRRYPRIHGIAVVDVSRGPGLGPDPLYQANIAMLKENNVTVLGYIAIEGHIDDIKQNMKYWRNWYPEIDGVYLTNISRDDTNLSFHEELVKYAKDYLEFKFVVAELSKVGRPTLPEQLVIKSRIDVFVSYRDRVVPAPLLSLMGGINPEKYQPHRFGVILTKIPPNVHSQNMIQNFVRQCITKNIARYFYFHTDDGAREMHPDPFTRISEYLEVTVNELNNIANEEDVLPAGPPVSTERVLPPNIIEDTTAQDNPNNRVSYDKFGIQKLLPDATKNFQEWYFQQDRDVTKDPRLKNTKGISLKRMQDGSKDTWLLSGNNVHLEAYSESEKKMWLNTETTIFFKYLRDSKKKQKNKYPYVLSIVARNYDDVGYETSVIKEDGRTTIRKMVAPSTYTPTRATQPAFTADGIKGKWSGFKQIVYNLVEEQQTSVVIETHILQNCTGPNGELVIPYNQNWRMTSRFVDKGYWGLENPKAEKKLNKNKPSTSVITNPADFIELVTDDVEMVITDWSVREVRVDSTD